MYVYKFLLFFSSVHPNTIHLIEPVIGLLAIYLPKKKQNKLNGFFPLEKENSFSRKILKKETYLIKEGTEYLLMAHESCFFHFFITSEENSQGIDIINVNIILIVFYMLNSSKIYLINLFFLRYF